MADDEKASETGVERATGEVVARLARRGVRVSGHETSDELVDLLDAVEAFERAVERAGGDLMVDEPRDGATRPRDPDDPAFVLPSRREGEGMHAFTARVTAAAAAVGHRTR